MPPAALLGDGDGAPKARKTGWRVARAVVVEDARRREREPIGPAERIAPQRRGKLAPLPEAAVARPGERGGGFFGAPALRGPPKRSPRAPGPGAFDGGRRGQATPPPAA